MRYRYLFALALVAVAGSLEGWLAAQAPPPVRIFERQASRAVRPQLDVLEEAGRRRGRVLMPVPGSGDVVVSLSHFEAQARGFFAAGPIVASATAGEVVDGEVTLTVVDGRVVGRMVRNGRLYRISRAADTDVHQIEEIDLRTVPLEAQPLAVAGDTATAAESDAPPPATADTNALVDLMIVYTPAARVWLGGTAGIQAEATAAVNNANLALANSGVTHRYRLVYAGEVSYTEAVTGSNANDSGTDLSRLQNVGDGHLDEVHALRDVHRADVVTLFTRASDACGYGYLMGPSNVNTAWAVNAFNVTIATCATNNLSMAHEIGHNIGLHHNREDAGGSPAYSFAYGYRIPGFGRTVMAYECPSGGSCARRTVFSSPSAVFPNTSTVSGTTTEDNARAMNLTAPYAANFRDSTCSFVVNPSSRTAPLAGGVGTISVTSSSGCYWNAVSSDPTVVSITSGASSSGSATVGYNVSASSSSRSATLTIAGQTVTISQGACTPEMFVTAGTPAPFTRTGGTGSITFTFASGCEGTAWTVSDDVEWVTWTSATSGTGSGTASFTVATNATESLRGANLTIAGTAFSSITRIIQQLGSRLVVAIPTQLLRAAKGGADAPLQAYTPQQRVSVTIEAPDARTWTATSDQPWLQVVRGAGTGSGSFDVRVANPGNVLGASVNVVANVTVTASGLTPQVWPFTLQVRNLTEAGLPFGFLDTPIDASTVSGAIPVTGWALALENVTRVDVWRDSIAGLDNPASIQPNGWVYVGQAAQIAGARPDVAAAFPSYPQRNQAGWGYLLLTNMLPHIPLGTTSGGQGAFRLHVTATQQSGVQSQLGEVTVNVDNDTATRPFGAIDTPTQGGTASSLYANFGWVLARGSALIPTDGSTMHVFIDGAPVGRPTYNQCRGSNLNGGGSSFLPPGGTCDDDIATLFASRGHLNVAPGSGRGAIGSFVIDTRTLSNGVHTIAWSVTDSLGRTEGIGSRTFTVTNGVASDATMKLHKVP